MKTTGITWLVFTSLVLVLLAILSALDFSFSLIFFIMIIGQILLVITVYRLLTDNYTTDKTFKDFYEDYTPKEDE